MNINFSDLVIAAKEASVHKVEYSKRAVDFCLKNSVDASVLSNLHAAEMFLGLQCWMDLKYGTILKQIKDLKEGDWFSCDFINNPLCVQGVEIYTYNGVVSVYEKDMVFTIQSLKGNNFKFLGHGKKKNKVLAFLSRNPYKWSDQMEEEYKKRRIRALGY